jgi:hypothetical protein
MHGKSAQELNAIKSLTGCRNNAVYVRVQANGIKLTNNLLYNGKTRFIPHILCFNGE